MAQLFAKYPDLSEFFDIPEATIEQRTACFVVLAHCALMHEIYETFAGRHEQSPSLGDEEKEVLRRTGTLFDSDAPAWVLELNEVAQRLPSRIYNALPEPLRAGGYGFSRDNPERMQAIQSAANALNSLEAIHALTERVLDQQLQRLARRWSAAIPTVPTDQAGVTKANRPKGLEALPSKKLDLSRYMDNLTEKQRMAFSLKNEYGLGLAEIAWRMDLDRKTAYEHIQAANRKIDQDQSREKRKTNRAQTSPEE